MKNLILIPLLSLLPLSAFCQKQIKEYVQQEMVSIKAIDPAAADFSDLEPIGAAIGDARIVMLGEQDHGDGATMLAKSRLVKYLHEEKGFNVLAFEGEFFSLNQGWDAPSKDAASVDTFLKANLFPVWSECLQCADLLYDYIPETFKTNTPLQVTGFDNQIGFKYSKEHLKSSLDQYLRKKQVA